MSELRVALDTLAGAGGAAVLATVVRVGGSAYRRPGARLVLCPDGRRVGLISGGCLEGDVAKKAWWRTEAGPVVVRYDTGSGDDTDGARAFGLGCNGVIDVLLERIDPAAPPAFVATLRDWVDARRVGVLARVVAGGRVGDWLTLDSDGSATNFADAGLADAVRAVAADALPGAKSRHAACGGAEVFVEVVVPPPALLVCGAGADAVPVAALAKLVGFHVAVCDRRAAFATRERFPTADAVSACDPADAARGAPAAAVVMSHNYDDDREYLRALLDSPARYVGVLGPRRRTDALLADLAADGFGPPTAGRLDRLYAPVGLDLGAETPEEIALAVVAEIRAALTGRGGGFLRDRRGPLHDRPPSAEHRAPAVAACAVGAG